MFVKVDFGLLDLRVLDSDGAERPYKIPGPWVVVPILQLVLLHLR